MSLLRTLLIIAIIYFAVRFIIRYFLPMLVKSAVNKAQENMMNKMDEMYRSQHPEEEISIRKNPSGNKRRTDEGEYVDYEELK